VKRNLGRSPVREGFDPFIPSRRHGRIQVLIAQDFVPNMLVFMGVLFIYTPNYAPSGEDETAVKGAGSGGAAEDRHDLRPVR
jgi:hypothetical protein